VVLKYYKTSNYSTRKPQISGTKVPQQNLKSYGVHGDMAQEAGGGGGESVSICTFVPVKQVN
jgi:hypothetical protein